MQTSVVFLSEGMVWDVPDGCYIKDSQFSSKDNIPGFLILIVPSAASTLAKLKRDEEKQRLEPKASLAPPGTDDSLPF